MKRTAREAGAAILIALLTVALVATFAAAALWQQWRSIEVESAERAQIQSAWILTGALDWTRLLLREDLMAGKVDHLAEPWAVPLQEARLSSFLAADRNNNADTGPDILDAFLSGNVIDLQSMMNVNNLVVNGKVQVGEVDAFARLFDVLGLPSSQLSSLVENLRFALDASAANRSSPMAPLPPHRLEELVWLGVPPATVSALQPYVTVLPGDPTKINVNTASAEVIYASMPSISMAEAQSLVARRERAPFRSFGEIAQALGKGDAAAAEGQVSVDIRSDFFEVRARLRLDKLVVEERAQIHRVGVNDIEIIQRQRGIVDPTALAQAAVRR